MSAQIEFEDIAKIRMALNSLESTLNYLERTDEHPPIAWELDRHNLKKAKEVLKNLHRNKLSFQLA